MDKPSEDLPKDWEKFTGEGTAAREVAILLNREKLLPTLKYVSNLPDSTRGTYDFATNTVELNKKDDDKQSTVAHELTHALSNKMSEYAFEIARRERAGQPLSDSEIKFRQAWKKLDPTLSKLPTYTYPDESYNKYRFSFGESSAFAVGNMESKQERRNPGGSHYDATIAQEQAILRNQFDKARQTAPWKMEWVNKSVQAISGTTESIKESLKDFKWPWEMDWSTKTTQPTQAPKELTKTASKEYDLKGYAKTLVNVESGGDKNAKSKTSTATGPAQFIERTWMEQVNKLNLPYTLKDRTDPDKVAVVLEAFSKQNLEKARKDLGRDPAHSELYLYHLGVPRLATAPVEEAAIKYASERQIKANRAIFFNKEGKRYTTPRTVGEVMNRFRNKFGETNG